MKFSIILANVGPSISDIGSDDRQYPNAEAAFKARYPYARIIDIEFDAEGAAIFGADEDGTHFVAQVTAIYDGSENAAAEAIGRKLDERDFGKTATEIVQAEDYRTERARD